MQHTEERASKIIDKLIDIVGSLYRIDEEVATTSEKIHFLSSLNSSTVNKLKEFVEQNLSYSMENETMEQVTGGNDGNSGYSMKFWLRITWDLLFFLIIFVAIVGNLLVLWIVTGNSWFIFSGFKLFFPIRFFYIYTNDIFYILIHNYVCYFMSKTKKLNFYFMV